VRVEEETKASFAVPSRASLRGVAVLAMMLRPALDLRMDQIQTGAQRQKNTETQTQIQRYRETKTERDCTLEREGEREEEREGGSERARETGRQFFTAKGECLHA
jgi:hypothetical protein